MASSDMSGLWGITNLKLGEDREEYFRNRTSGNPQTNRQRVDDVERRLDERGHCGGCTLC